MIGTGHMTAKPTDNLVCVIVCIQKGNPSYGQLTLGNTRVTKESTIWRVANDIESEIYYSSANFLISTPKNMELALKHI